MRPRPHGRPVCDSRWSSGMAYDMTPDPQLAAPARGVLLSPTDLTEAIRELESLRSAHRAQLAERLRDARAYGTAVDDDDHLAVLEDVAIERVKIAQLERLVASATVVDVAVAGAGFAGLGSVVRVQDEAGRETEYKLVGRRTSEAKRTHVTPASPVGAALLGARTGESVRITLPDGRERTLTVLAVLGSACDEPGS
jgi:transcription elongation factor GreA